MKKKDLTFLLWLLAVALLLRLFRIGSQSLWVDELLTLKVSVPGPGLNIWDYLKYNIHGPLHSFVIWMIHFVSMHDGWLRLPSAVAGVGGVYYFYRWVCVWLNHSVARRASVLLAIHPLHIYYSQECRNYSLLFFFAMLASYVLHRLLKDESVKNYGAYLLGISGAALCNLSSAFLYVIHSLIFLLRRAGVRRRLTYWAVLSVLVLVLISPWVYRVYQVIDVSRLVTPVLPGEIEERERLRGDTTVNLAVIPYTFYAFSAGFSLGPSTRELHRDASLRSVLSRHAPAVLWVSLLFGLPAVLGMVAAVRGGRPWRQILLYLLLPIVFVVAICWQNAKAYNVRYVLLALPAYLCVVAIGLQSLPGRWSHVVSALVGVTMLYSLGNYYFKGAYAREDVREAARYVQANASPGDCVLAPTVLHVFTHYYGGEGVYAVGAPTGKPRVKVDEELEKLFANCETLWYVRAREWEDDPQSYVLDTLEHRLVRTQSIEYNGVKVIAYRRPDPR